jgi:hypothetical protein
MTVYATLAEAKQMMDAQSSTDDAKLFRLIQQVSARIDRMFLPKRPGPVFAPSIATRNNFRLDGSRVDSYLGTFYMGEPLLTLNGVTVGDQALVVGSNVQAYQGDLSPYLSLQLINRCCGGWFQYVNCSGCLSVPFVGIAGVWGYHVDYANAWVDTLQKIENAGGINASATSITVTDPEAANALGNAPNLSQGNLIQIDTEWMDVTAVDTAANTITVRRGVNGSTAASHAEDAPIYTYAVDPAINRATYKQAGLEYATIGVYPTSKSTGGASAEFAPDVLYEFSALLTLFANW